MRHKSSVWLNLVVEVTRTGRLLRERLEVRNSVNLDVVKVQCLIAAEAALPEHGVQLVIGKGDIDAGVPVT